MSPNTKMDSSSSPPPSGTCSPCHASTATGLISPFAHATAAAAQQQQHDNKCPALPNKSETDLSLPPNTPQVDSYQISHIEQARRRIKSSMEHSPLLTNSNAIECIFPRFHKDELVLGSVLGRGGFGTVLEIRDIIITTSLVETETAAENGNDSSSPNKKEMKKKKKRQLHRPTRIKCQSFDGASSTTTNHNNNKVHHGRKSPVRNITRGLRTKAKSWNARAHEVSMDVGHFFHQHHRGSDAAAGGEDTIGEEEEFASKNVENGLEQQQDDDSVKDDAAANDAIQEQQQQQQQQSSSSSLPRKTKRTRQISRNFSLKAWRESDPGTEGDDAIPPEEMERYKLDYSTSRHQDGGDTDHSCTNHDENGEKNEVGGGYYQECENDCLVDEVVCPGTNHLSNVLENAENQPSDTTHFGVYETIHPTTNDTKDNDDSQQQSSQRRRIIFFQQPPQDKQFISENTTTSSGECRYVIKIIQPEIVQSDFKKFLQAAMDMATETKFLSVLSHPHILQMRAVGQGDMFSPEYFLVLDRLYDTLLDRVEGSWKAMSDHLENDFLVWSRASKVKMLWVERMGVMRDVAGALAYIHSLGIVYRDIKPENIGFDSKGVVKLFDFGLAKEVRKEDESPNGTYKLTPETGSLRYMAPEVGNKWPYNFLADSYSFGIMLWEVTSLSRPFALYTPNEIRDMVMKWGERPKVKDTWPERVKELITTAWDSSFRKRPTMEAFREALDMEVMEGLQ